MLISRRVKKPAITSREATPADPTAWLEGSTARRRRDSHVFPQERDRIAGHDAVEDANVIRRLKRSRCRREPRRGFWFVALGATSRRLLLLVDGGLKEKWERQPAAPDRQPLARETVGQTMRGATFCEIATRPAIPSGSIRSRRDRSCRLGCSHEVCVNGGCHIRTTALICPTASGTAGAVTCEE